MDESLKRQIHEECRIRNTLSLLLKVSVINSLACFFYSPVLPGKMVRSMIMKSSAFPSGSSKSSLSISMII